MDRFIPINWIPFKCRNYKMGSRVKGFFSQDNYLRKEIKIGFDVFGIGLNFTAGLTPNGRLLEITLHILIWYFSLGYDFHPEWGKRRKLAFPGRIRTT